MMRKLIPLTLIIFLYACHTQHSRIEPNSVLWYTYPAKYWNSQGLHLGNGYFGATFMGGINKEVISLSEKSMWTGGPANGNWEKAGVNPRANKMLPEIRKSTLKGDIRRADSLVVHDFFGQSDLYGHFTSVGDLIITLPDSLDNVSNYRRELDLSKSLGHVIYNADKRRYQREYFCSYPDRILAVSYTCDAPGSVSLSLGFNILQDSSTCTIKDNTIEIKGFINGNHRPFVVSAVMEHEGGSIISSGSNMILQNADRAMIYLTIATNYKLKYPDYTGEDPQEVADSIIRSAGIQSYAKLRQRHISDYQSLYNRVKLEIPGDPKVENLSTDQRFNRLKSGNPDAGYKVLAFNLGRYLIISSSRPGSLPANLQGVWNIFKEAPWAGNYQSNINLQEIYWSCGPVDLPECQQSYIDWIENLAISGREIARRCYGTDGWVSHSIGNIWGHAAPMGGIQWGMYPVGAAWHCQHVWDQFAFTQDSGYLKKQAYPILKDASVFWLENLVPFNGYLISAPTVSAEHGALQTGKGLNPAYHDFQSKNYIYDIPGVYQDVEMIWDLFTNTSKAARLIGDQSFADSLIRMRERLLPLKTGKYGQLQEWNEDIDNPECHHRHIAHLYAVCPGSEINPFTTPGLAAAARKALDLRGDGRYPEQELASGGNWARADRMWCWTRLLDGNRADKIMTKLLTEQGFENVTTYQHADYNWQRSDQYKENDSLFCHFQLDASASLSGCLAEMLLQSHLDEIDLLPALPDELNTGKISGLRARGGFMVDLAWEKGSLINAIIHCHGKAIIPVIRIKGIITNPDENDQIKIIRDL